MSHPPFIPSTPPPSDRYDDVPEDDYDLERKMDDFDSIFEDIEASKLHDAAKSPIISVVQSFDSDLPNLNGCLPESPDVTETNINECSPNEHPNEDDDQIFLDAEWDAFDEESRQSDIELPNDVNESGNVVPADSVIRNEINELSAVIDDELNINNDLELDMDDHTWNDSKFDDFKTAEDGECINVTNLNEEPNADTILEEPDTSQEETVKLEALERVESVQEKTSESEARVDNSEDIDDDWGDFGGYSNDPQPPPETPTTQEEVCSIDEEIKSYTGVVGSQSDIHHTDEPESNKSELGETWKRLKETENTQQPFSIHRWPSSNGQTTLLTSLDIDAMNLLFAPNRGRDMPLFVSNQCLVPLKKTKKDLAPSSIGYTDAEPEKTDEILEPTSFEIETPIQASDYPAAITEDATPVEVVVHKVPFNIGKQINLPDTHIFTPSDSEVPLSKTIHYNSNLSAEKRSSPEVDGATPVEAAKLPLSAVVLEPLKVEPAVPTIKWPNPGHLQEYYNFETTDGDFGDFQMIAPTPAPAVDEFSEFQSVKPVPVAAPAPQLQTLQPVRLEDFNHLNWSTPNIDLQNLKQYNPMHSMGMMSDPDDDWTDFVGGAPRPNAPAPPPADDADWSDFLSGTPCVSSSSSELRTISLDVHSNRPRPSNTNAVRSGNASEIIPSLSFNLGHPSQSDITRNNHFQNL